MVNKESNAKGQKNYNTASYEKKFDTGEKVNIVVRIIY